jgi:hypothetical protein
MSGSSISVQCCSAGLLSWQWSCAVIEYCVSLFFWPWKAKSISVECCSEGLLSSWHWSCAVVEFCVSLSFWPGSSNSLNFDFFIPPFKLVLVFKIGHWVCLSARFFYASLEKLFASLMIFGGASA